MKGCVAVAVVIMAFGTAFGGNYPISYEDTNGVPITGATIWAATWGSRPPDTLQIATEQGAGIYYFRIGTGGSQLPSGYYDIWREGILDSAWAGFYLAVGNMPPVNSLDSTYYKDGGFRYDQDAKQTYGDQTTDMTTTLKIIASTKSSVSANRNAVNFQVTNYETGRNKSVRVNTLILSNNSAGLNDSTASPACLSWDLLSNDTGSLGMFNKWTGLGPTGLYGRLRCKYSGVGSFIDVRQGNNYALTSAGEIVGYKVNLAVDSLPLWYNPIASGNEIGLFAGTIKAQKTPEGWGLFADVEGDTSFYWAFGSHVRVQNAEGLGSTPPREAYGHYNVTHGYEKAQGFKTFTYGRGPGAMVKGVTVWAGQDTTRGMGSTVHGGWFHALHRPEGERQGHKRAWGVEALAGADTAYGGDFLAVSDQDQGSNKAYGLRGHAKGGVNNYGLNSWADGASDGNFAVNNYGARAWAANGGNNYGGYFRATDPGVGQTNYGIYAWADSGAMNWAGFFKGRLAADSAAFPADAPYPQTYPARFRLTPPPVANGVAQYVKLGTSNGQTGLWIDGGSGSAQYGMYLDGFTGSDYALYVGQGTTRLNTTNVEGKLSASGGAKANYLEYSSGVMQKMCGTATVPSGCDTARVFDLATVPMSSDEIVIMITALDRTPDGATPMVGHIATGDFTIYCSTIQSADQDFYWIAVKPY